MRTIHYLLATVTCLLSLQAIAHWQWLDKDGHKVFSDRAPPPEIPEKNILQRPVTLPTATPPQATASSPRLGGVDRELVEKKKKVEEAEAGKRRADDDKVAASRAENCARAKRAKVSFDSGRSIARSNEQGEPEILDAAGRAAELKRIQAIIDVDCN